MVVLGVVLLLCGVLLALVPVGAARFANHLRYVPYSSNPSYVRQYRIAGVTLAVIGVCLAILL